MKLQGEKVRLRLPEPSDVDQIYRWENNPENWRVSDTLFPYSRKQIEEFVLHTRDLFQARQLRFMIEELQTSTVAGCIDIFDFDPFNSRAGIGILIEAGKMRGKGYARESLSILHDYAFNLLMINQLYCQVAENNERSLKLFTSAGYEIAGIKKQWIRAEGEFLDVYFLQLLNRNMTD